MLIKYYAAKGAVYCANILKRKPEIIRVKASKLGLAEVHQNWSVAELDFLKQNYIQHGSRFCADNLPGRTRQAIIRQANKLGLKIKNIKK